MPVTGSHTSEPTRNAPYIIPVVFHVLHVNGPENISDAQILDAMRIMNEDFNKRNADTATVVQAFKINIANSQVEFRLAKKDPTGAPTTGINRIYTTLTNHGWDDSSKISQWPQNKYLNIWVCKSLDGHAAAYSWYPSYAGSYPQLDGIMTLHDYVGSIGTSNSGNAHVLTHEVGHFFNLKHTWDDVINGGPCGDDEVADTPVTKSSGCTLTLAECNPPILENVQNFMTGSYCFRMFTNGQKDRMHACLNSGVGKRIELWQTGNLTDTGVLDNLSIPGIAAASLVLFPNPASDQVVLQSVNGVGSEYEISVYDIAGKQVYAGRWNGKEPFTLGIGNLQDGSYQLVAITKDASPFFARFVKKGNE